MKAEFKKLWVDALRSGEYRQTERRLTLVDEDGNKSHCCLGVLCDLTKDTLGLEVTEPHTDTIAYNGDHVLLPNKVSEQLGLGTSFGIPDYRFYIDPSRSTEAIRPDPFLHGELKSDWVSSEAVSLHLASLNDAGLTFSQIADIIEWAEPAEGGE